MEENILFWKGKSWSKALGEFILIIFVSFAILWIFSTHHIRILNNPIITSFTLHLIPVLLILLILRRHITGNFKSFLEELSDNFWIKQRKVKITLVSVFLLLYSLALTMFIWHSNIVYKITGGELIPNLSIVFSDFFVKLGLEFLVQFFVVAFFEEFVFRGYILNFCRLFFNSLVIVHWEFPKRLSIPFAIGISSLLFAIFHYFNTSSLPLQLEIRMLQTFSFGIVLGMIYVTTKNLLVVSLLHAGINTFLIFFEFLWNDLIVRLVGKK